MTNIPPVQLLGGASSMPFDVTAAGGSLTYGQMATAQGLAEIATYANGVGPSKGYVIQLSAVSSTRPTARISCVTRTQWG
jgi:glycerophosphoryl diester phosphodiesterase